MGSRNNLQILHRLSNKVGTEGKCKNKVETEGNCTPGPSNNNKGEKDTRLWHACARPLVKVPSVGDKVFYFPQGHIEQVGAHTSQEGTVDMPIYDIPSRISCEVVGAQLQVSVLQAEAHTDEVYAQITLLPKQEGTSLEIGSSSQSMSQQLNSCCFSKRLTPSDTSMHGGFSVPKRYANECFPPLDMSQEPPAQELVAEDLHGSKWRFRHIYRGQPKRHLLTSGWSSFVGAKKLVAGDACIFLRGENGELFVGIRRAAKQQANTSASFLSGHSMQHGILSSAFHAMKTETEFTVYYRPWTSPADFIIPHDQYMKSAEIDFSIGTRFRMQFEGEECPESKPSGISGTIVGIDSIDPIRWNNSEWRCLEVEWDVRSRMSVCPQRVSPWSIEPTGVKKKNFASLFPHDKRARPLDPATPNFPGLAGDGQKSRAMRASELGKSGQQLMLLQPNLVQMRNPFRHSQSSAKAIPGGNHPRPMIANYQPPTFTSCGAYKGTEASGSFSFQKVIFATSASQDCTTPEEKKDEIGAPMAQPNGNHQCMLFGVNISSSPTALLSHQILSSQELYSPCPSPVSEPSKGFYGNNPYKKCRNCCPSAIQSCTKVLKHGTALGRSVDLSRFDGYGELIHELDQMFEFKGTLIDKSSGWYVTYKDHEGDMMLIGDFLWPDFQTMVRKMFVCPKEDVDKLDLGSPNPVSS